MLKPSYIFENPDARQPGQPRESQENIEEKINPKLRQIFETKTKIEPFYSGGKLSILSPCHFACQCDSSVKVISTVKVKSKSSVSKLADLDSDSLDKSTASKKTSEDDEDKKIDNDGFEVLGNYECELDEIIGFDANPKARVLLTAHKSNLLRLWQLNDTTNPPEAKRTIKSLHSTPIIHLLFDLISPSSESDKDRKDAKTKTSDPDSLPMEIDIDIDLDEKLLQENEASLNNLRWASVAGSILKIWETGGNLVSKGIKVDNIASIGLVKWGPASHQKNNTNANSRLFAAERKIYVIDINEETKQYAVSHVCDGHFSQVTGIEWASPKLMISGGRDNVIIFWDVENSFNRLTTIQCPGSVEALILTSPSDLYLALGASDIRHFDIEKKRLSNKSVLNLGKDETVISFHPSANVDDKITLESEKSDSEFWISTLSSSVYQVQSRSSKKKSSLLQMKKQFVGNLGEIFAVALWSDMKVAVANNTSIIRVYNLESGSCKFLRGHTDIVMSLSVHKEWLVSGSKDNLIMLWKEDSDEPQFTLHGHLESVTAVCFDPLRLIIYSAGEDKFIKTWNQERCIQSCIAHDKEMHSLHCSPNGAMIVSASRDKTAKIWDSDTLGLLGTLKGHKKSVWDAKFSAWDQLVVTASADTTLKIWSIPSFNCIKTLQGHLSSVLQATFVNSGLQVLSTSSDGTLKTWDLRSSTCIGTYEQADHKIWALDTVPDGSLVVTGSADSILTVSIDVTEEKYQEKVEKKNKIVEQDQKLTNLLRKGEWQHAIKLSIELDRPFTLLKIIRDISDVSELEFVIASLPKEYKAKMMTYAQKWNTNTRTSTEAQVLLNILLTSSHPSELTYLKTWVLLPYTQKHFQRVQKNLQQIALVKYLAEKSD